MKGASLKHALRKRALPLLVALIASTALPAAAGTLYKCTGADGVPNYVSKRVGGASCEVISRYTPDNRSRSGISRPSGAGGAVSTPATPTTTLGAASTGAVITMPVSASANSVVPASIPAVATTAPKVAKSGNTRRVVSGQVYSFIKDGVRHYTSARPKGADSVASIRTIKYSFIETCFACAANPGVNFGTLRLNTAAYQAEIAAAARQYGVEEAVVRAIIHAESSFNPMALSHAGAQGLMQLMPATARRFGVTDSYDAGQNIRGGVQYLAWLLKRFNGNLTLAAAGYNAGEGAVDRHGGVPPYQETQRYVARVGVLADRYRGTVGAR
ncbi:transglycosylase [Pseudoxanthomonas yeongjuensis]|uniref:lytic transglycosylase domain-containing protein n=1 Tax=Pseudoxanthomonas yeongjuensis TaxID=377616 RepID=UPI0013908D9F|nr:lytic transglycosylase domain-containing protein [Pseudoxanthomonas yeongjuensis]KAF1718431.1 transglycosylase [Pseudoxanthomonas yeongjuensis]